MAPAGGMFDSIRASVLALLRLSDAFCERAELEAWQLGAEFGRSTLNQKQAARLLPGQNRLSFDMAALQASGVEIRALRPFIFQLDEAPALANANPQTSPLEQQPIIYSGDAAHVLLPTAIGSAIRRFVINALQGSKNAEALRRSTVNAYSKLWFETKLLGGSLKDPLEFQEQGGVWWAEQLNEVDFGIFVHLLFVTDPLDGNATDIWEGGRLSAEIDRRLEAARKTANGLKGKRGLTLVVGCGLGRGAAFEWSKPAAGWRIEFLSAYDFQILSSLPRFDLLNVWRLLEQRDEAERLGLELMNINGLVNLVGWARRLDGHLVPHADLPDGEAIRLIAVDQTMLRMVRRAAHIATDTHVVLDIRERPLRLHRVYDDTFEEDLHDARYFSLTSGPSGMPLIATPTARRTWWADVVVPRECDGHLHYERAKTVQLWLSRAAPVLDELNGLPEGAIEWRVEFAGPEGDSPTPDERLSFEDALREIEVSVDGRTITTQATKRYELAWLNETNIAERALVAALIEGVSSLSNVVEPERKAELLDRVIPAGLAKQQHGFVARGLRDWLREDLRGTPIAIEQEDDALQRLGLAWKVRDRFEPNWIDGKEACTSFLNALVTRLEDELCTELRQYERVDLIEALLRNYEQASADKELWSRTAASNLALRRNRESTVAVLVRRQAELNAGVLASRLLIEIGACECPMGVGKPFGKLDLGRLLARMMLIFQLGGMSDAVRWDAMEPRLRVTPYGDVHGKFDWHENFVQPFGERIGGDRVEDAEGGYAENLQPLPVNAEASLATFDPLLDEAWTEQFGATFQQCRLVMEDIETRALRAGKAVLRLTRNELDRFAIDNQVVEGEVAKRLVEGLTSVGRCKWRSVPDGFKPSDIFPWRFKRRLSLLRRPLVDLGDGTVLLAPGMLREGLAYQLGGFLQGEFPRQQLSPTMRMFLDKVVTEKGRKLAEEVKTKLEAAGWTVWTERKLSQLLNRKLDRDYGDVDVLARKSDRLPVIECKDLKFPKTDGEIAEQVRDYAGVERDGKRDELKKHLDRVAVLGQNLPALGRFVGIPNLVEIESHLVFRNPTPVIYALSRVRRDVAARTLREVGTI